MPATPPDPRDDWARGGGDPTGETGRRRGARRRAAEPGPDAPVDGPRQRVRPAVLDLDLDNSRHPGSPGPDVGPPESGDDASARSLPVVPVRRLLSLGLAGLSALLTAALVVGAQLDHGSYVLVVLGVQVIFVVVWTVASQPPAPRIAAAVGLAVAVSADLASVWTDRASLSPLVYLTAAGFVVAVIGQLLRRTGRVRVTESLGSSLVVVLGAMAGATLVVLSREPLGAQVISACMVAAGVGLAVAHLTDLVAAVPRVAPSVPRGGAGIIVGAMAGTAAAGVVGAHLEGLSTLSTAVAGLAAALIALMVDLSADYAEASRQLAGATPALWLVRHMQGPLTAFVITAPTAYAAYLVLARGL